jgi:lipopolysaccharide transport system permease protein
MSTTAGAMTVNRPGGRWPRVDLRELWAYRDVALSLAVKDLKLRYRQAFFGVAWALIQPAAAAFVFTVFLGRLAGLPSEGLPYAVFVYAGLVAWTYLSNAVSGAANSLVGNAALVSKVYFPRALAPVAALIPGLVDLAVSLVLLAVLMAAYGVAPGAALVLLPLLVLWLATIALGAGLWLAALNVEYRDVRHALPFALQVWLFASPIVYPSSLVEGAWRYAYALNPVVGLVDASRWSLLDAPAPGAEVLVSVAASLVLLVGGLLYFAARERRFADVI